MMTHEQVSSFLRKVTYKPNWRFRIDKEASKEDWVVISVESDYVQDIYSPFEKIRIEITQAIVLPITTEGSIKYLVGEMIKRIENHEFEEWFKFEGKCVRQPHHKRD